MKLDDLFDRALKCVNNGKFEDAQDIFEELLKLDPENVDLLYNSGMCYTELGEPKKAIELLDKCIQFDPSFSNAHVAISYAHSKIGNLDQAKTHLLKAIELDPNNSYALKNLGGLLGKEGDHIKSLYYLKRSFENNPFDPLTVYGLGLTYKELDDYENSAKYFNIFLEMDGPEPLKNHVKDYLRDLAEKELKSVGLRIDAVFYMVHALELFENKSFQDVQIISSEIGLKGQSGIDINDPAKQYSLDSLDGKFSGLELISTMYVGFKKIAPNLDIGIDLSEEYDMALKLFNSDDLL